MNPARLEQAELDFPGVKLYEKAEHLGDAPAIEIVIISTPPNNHAVLSVLMIERGKHVICEKPLALSVKETDMMVAAAAQHQVHLSCHQNRRWDVDYLAIKQALEEGLLGDLFYLETFVGGYKHPCGYWHSHEPVSGGTAYDWGSHYIDWIVGLIRDRVTSIIGTRHKRVWRDVSNADQERIQIRFAGGQEAEFLHSDIAAVRKPKWYLLGTKGAIVGHWRDVTNYEIDPVVYFNEHSIPPTEMTPDLALYQRHHSGQVVRQRLPLPPREHFMFLRNIADHLLTGEPLVAPLADSIRGVAILEAAARSARCGGKEEVVDV
jgi:predicted dehydrogenase